MSWRLAGLGWPSIQKGREELWIIGREPSVMETAWTPGISCILSSKWRRRARVSAELVVGAAGRDKLKVIAWLALKPGFKPQSAGRLPTIKPPPTDNTRSTPTSQ